MRERKGGRKRYRRWSHSGPTVLGDTLGEAQPWPPLAALTQDTSTKSSPLGTFQLVSRDTSISYLGSDLSPDTYWLCALGRSPLTRVPGEGEDGRAAGWGQQRASTDQSAWNPGGAQWVAAALTPLQ